MQNHLSQELYWLVLTVVMTGLLWVPYIINRMKEHGVFPAIWNPEPDIRPQAQWAERMMKAHANAVENMVVFAPLVLTAHVVGYSSPATIAASKIYFFARAAHYLLYTFRVPLMRTIVFLIGVYCQLVFGFGLLGL